MSIAAMNWAWSVKGLKASQKLVLMKLADHANDDGLAWPGKGSLADQCDVSKRTVDAAITHLAERRLIRVEKRKVKNNGSGKLNDTNLYHLNLEQRDLFDGGGAKTALVQNLQGCNSQQGVVQSVQEGSAKVAPESSLKPSIEPSSYSAAAAAAHEYTTAKGKILKGEKLSRFEGFWIDFDYKRGKAEAADAWLTEVEPLLKRNLGLYPQIRAAARKEAAGREDLKAHGGTPKMAQGWLSARRFEDYAEDEIEAQTKREDAPWWQSWEGVKERGYALGILDREYPEPVNFAAELVRRLEAAGEDVPSYLIAYAEGRA